MLVVRKPRVLCAKNTQQYLRGQEAAVEISVHPGRFISPSRASQPFTLPPLASHPHDLVTGEQLHAAYKQKPRP